MSDPNATGTAGAPVTPPAGAPPPAAAAAAAAAAGSGGSGSGGSGSGSGSGSGGGSGGGGSGGGGSGGSGGSSSGGGGSAGLDELRIRFGRSVGRSYWILVVLIPLLIVVLVLILTGVIKSAETIDKLALGAALLVGLGMYLGFMSLYFGVMMTWLGIEAAFNLSAQGKGEGKEAQITFSSASPGLLFGLMGGVMVVACLYKTIEFSEKGIDAKASAKDTVENKKPSREGPAAGIYPPNPDGKTKSAASPPKPDGNTK